MCLANRLENATLMADWLSLDALIVLWVGAWKWRAFGLSQASNGRPPLAPRVLRALKMQHIRNGLPDSIGILAFKGKGS